MKDKKDKLTRQAYIDQQLSVEEVIVFEDGLSRTDKIEIEADKQFEQALLAKLAENAECPDELWDDIRSRIAFQSSSWFTLFRLKALHMQFVAVAAVFFAVIIAAALVLIPLRNDPQEIPSVLFSDDLAEFSRPASILGNFENIRNSLLENGFTIDFSKPSNGGVHKIKPLGLRYVNINGKNIAQLYFSCCARPVTVFIGQKGVDQISDHLQVENSFETLFEAHREMDNHHLFIIGPHPPTDILDLFS